MISNWQRLILKNFGKAAPNYNKEAQLQRAFAWRLAKICSKESIPEGVWIDLGSGTGLLAEALETLHPNKSVFRVDGSKEMLAQHPVEKQTQLWDLNCGLPSWPKQPSLIASSFTLHWLNDPTNRIEEWFSALSPGGLLAIALPVQGSFQEWRLAAQSSHVPFSAIPLPSQESLLKGLNKKYIRYQKLHSFTQEASGINSLLKPMVKVGAQASPQVGMSVSDWRRLKQAWPDSIKDGTVKLTWLIQILLAKR